MTSTLSPAPSVPPGAADDGRPTPWTSPRRRPRRRGAVLLLAGLALSAVGAAWSLDSGDVRAVTTDDVSAPAGPGLPTAPAILRPAQGVYRYVGSGTDRLDLPPKVQPQGPEMAATVTHRADGCWTFRIELSSSHWQSSDYCPRDGGLVETGGVSSQSWDFGVFVQDVDLTFVCDAPTVRADQQPGQAWPQRCEATRADDGSVTVSEGPFTFLGTETLEIDGERVAAHHYRRERTASGEPAGTERSDLWFSAADGLPLRNVRRLTASTPSPIGTITYTEDARFEATSTRPVR